ncbi:serine/threonine-protein kinase [Kribbella catacumbae]|uniref:serine/threonine-protein kinase n=1 Tax=Kribbella catacumbae TaxID=460086 RepID=UPI0003A62DDF|nr:serine/threonine-protein kinase [Kribbella catacumbae]
MADVFAGRYELIDPVGSGGNSMVWRAWDRRLGRVCAAKVLRQRHAGALLRFVREQGLRLDHPQVLSPYSWAAEDDQALLAMDLVGGGSVSSLIADFGALPVRYAAELLAQLLGALDHVHAAGLVHRDVKPANLLLEATGTGSPVLRLSDFGIALSLGEPRLTQHGAIVGTPGYVAPEALAGEPPSISQDLYAVGVTGWQLLTGEEPPATGPPPSRPPAAAAVVDADIVWRVVENLMHPEPADRTRSAKDALAALAPVLAKPLKLPALTLDGEPIEVFDQLPPLPEPYDTLATQPEPLDTPDESAPLESHPPSGSPQPNLSPGPQQPSEPTQPPEPSQSSRSTAAYRPGQASELPQPVASSSLTESTERPAGSGRRRRVVLAAASGLVLVAAAVVAVLVLDGKPPGKESPGSQQSSPPATIRTGPVTPAPNAGVKVGGTCGWQEAGNVETTTDGTRIVCRQQGSSYRWVKA